MTIRNLDPSGELGKLFFQIQSKDRHDLTRTGAQPASTLPSRDAVDLSAVAQALQELTSRAGNLPDVRSEKLQALQQRIKDGEPLASAEQVAGALLRETLLNHIRR
jgi:flagellar biosynthesis anti-sigma factor FlgM